MVNIVLASTSPYRKEILEKLQIAFHTCAPNIDESRTKDESPEQLVERLAIEKAFACLKNNDDSLIIGSDQVAVIDGDIIGKPNTHENAITQLKQASGKHVRFLTGLCLLNSKTKLHQSEVVPYTVVFKELSETQIENYLIKEQPYNSAGSFKSEGLGICLFDKLIGDDPNTLIGLPLIRLVSMLAKEDVNVL